VIEVDKLILGFSNSESVLVPAWKPPEYMELMVRLSRKQHPTVCYVGAASGDDPRRMVDFKALCERVECKPSWLRVFHMTTDHPAAYFDGADIIYVDGGSTRNLLALLREWDAIDALVAAYQRGVLIAGASAGISMLFEQCISDSVRTKIRPVRGIGLLPGTVCAHYNVREERRDVLRSLVNTDRNALPAYALDDGVAALFVNGRLSRSYTIVEGARLHEFVVRGDSVEHLVQTP